MPVALFLLLGAQLQNAPRLRAVAPCGALVLVERIPDAKGISLQLFASSRNSPETTQTHGRRHLLEHVLAKGPNFDLDARLEACGLFLSASTTRDYTRFEISGSSESLVQAFAAMREILLPLATDPEHIKKESDIIEQEIALLSPEVRFSTAAWEIGFGKSLLDPYGTVSVLRATSPDELRAAQANELSGNNLLLSVSGPADVDETLKQGLALFAGLPKLPRELPSERPGAKPGIGEASERGEARAAIAPSVASPKTLCELAFAMGVASQDKQCRVHYTVSNFQGLVLLTHPIKGRLSGLLEESRGGKLDALFLPGRSLVRSWVAGYLRTASGSAFLRGVLALHDRALQPEAILNEIDGMTLAGFREAAEAFRIGHAIEVVGKP